MARKGDFQMSLGLIVAVVFSVILLTLAIMWLQGIMGDVGGLTHQVTALAKSDLLNTLAEGSKKVGIAAPPVTQWKKGETGSYAVGIRNQYSDKDITFGVAIYLDKVGGELRSVCSDGKPCNGLDSDAEGWLTYSDELKVDRGSSQTLDVIIKPNQNSKPGIYQFKIYVCESRTCDKDSQDVYGNAQFALEIGI